MTERAMTKADLVTAIILVVFSAAVVANSLSMPTMADRNESAYSGPGLVPAFVGAMIFLLSSVMLVRAVRRGAPRMFAEAASAAKAAETGAAPKPVGANTTRRIAWTIGLCAAYALLLGRAWFPLVTFLFVFGFVIVFEYDVKVTLGKQWKVPVFAAVLALLTAGAVFGVFQYLFLVNLP